MNCGTALRVPYDFWRFCIMARFTLPRDLYHGKGALEALKSFTGKKAMICVGGGSMKRFGFLDRAVEYLKEAGMEVELFEGIEPDPSVETVMRGAEAMLKFEPDWIIAMGGGSPIDAAKAMWIKYEYPEITFEEMCKVFGIPPLRRKAHFCAISSKVISGYSYLIHIALAASMGEPPPIATIQSGSNFSIASAPFMTVVTEGSGSMPSNSSTSMPASFK